MDRLKVFLAKHAAHLVANALAITLTVVLVVSVLKSIAIAYGT